MQVLAKHIQSTQFDGGNFQIFNDLKIIMDKYVLRSQFYSLDKDGVDVVFGYMLIQLVGTVNINVEKKILKLWYKKKKITLQDISLTTNRN